MGRAQGGSLDTWRAATRQIPETIPAKIRAAGLDYDLIDDEALAVTAPERYRVIIMLTRAPSRRRPQFGWITHVRPVARC